MRIFSRHGARAFLSLLIVAYLHSAAAIEEFRSVDGSRNNLKDPLHGSAGQVLRRNLDANFQYRDELLDTAFTPSPEVTADDLPAANPQPNPRTISNRLSDSESPPKNDRNNLLETFFGQFVNHDKEDTRSSNTEFFSVPIESTADPFYRPGSLNSDLVGVSEPPDDSAERDVPNNATSWLDLSTVYGSSDAVMNDLRTGSGGLLKTKTYAPFGPFSVQYPNELPSQVECPACEKDPVFALTSGAPNPNAVVAGDFRVGENVALALIHTVYHREHNRLANLVAAQNPGWTDEQIFQSARKLNIAQYQRTIIEEYLPEVLRGLRIPKYRGYKKNTESSTSIEFATGAFRYGHSTTAPYKLLDADKEPLCFFVPPGVFGPAPFTTNELPFAGQLGGFFTVHVAYASAEGPVLSDADGPQNILRGLVNTPVDEPDLKINDVLRNIQIPGLIGNGVDLLTSDIVRGRETGLPSYYELRKEFYVGSRQNNLYKAKRCDKGEIDSIECFLEINADPEVAGALQAIYGKVTAIDGVIGLLAENKEDASEYLPRTSAGIILDEYVRSRDGDRFWYEQEGYLSAEEAEIIGDRRFVEIVRDNFPNVEVSDNVFMLAPDADPNFGVECLPPSP